MQLQLIIITLLIVIITNTAFALSEVGQGISQSTFIHRLDNPSDEIDPRKFAYLHAGTRVILYDKRRDYRGSERRLILSEDGIWGYIKDKNYWKKDGLDYFGRKNLNTFITRNHDVVVEISPELSFRLLFTRGEVHKQHAEDEDSITLEVSERKDVGELPRSVLPLVTIPRKNAVIVNHSSGLSSSKIKVFQVSILNGVSGIKKRCNTTEVSATKTSASAAASGGFSLSKFFASLSAKAGVEVTKDSEKIETFDENENVTRTYYTRRGEPGLYKITKIRGCESVAKEKFIFTPPDNQEVILDENWAVNKGLKTDAATGRTLITCAEQYFSFYDHLHDQGVQEKDIPFLISHTGKFEQLDAPCQYD